MSKLYEMVQVCEEFPGKRIQVRPQWKTIRIPQRFRYYPNATQQQQYNSLPNPKNQRSNELHRELVGVGHRNSISLNRNVNLNNGFGNGNLPANTNNNNLNNGLGWINSSSSGYQGNNNSNTNNNNQQFVGGQMNKFQPQHFSTDSAFDGISTQSRSSLLNYESNESIDNNNKQPQRRTSLFETNFDL